MTPLCRWGTSEDMATTLLHLSLSTASLVDFARFIPVHSRMLSCLCKVVFARPDDLETCPYHLSFRFLIVVVQFPEWFSCELLYLSHDLRNGCPRFSHSIASWLPVSSFVALLWASTFRRHTGRPIYIGHILASGSGSMPHQSGQLGSVRVGNGRHFDSLEQNWNHKLILRGIRAGFGPGTPAPKTDLKLTFGRH